MKIKKGTGKISFNNILYLTHYIQNSYHFIMYSILQSAKLFHHFFVHVSIGISHISVLNSHMSRVATILHKAGETDSLSLSKL